MIFNILEVAIDVENCHKELDKKNKSQRIQAFAPSASKRKKKKEVFNIQISKAHTNVQDPKDEAARKEEYERTKNASTHLMKILKIFSRLC